MIPYSMSDVIKLYFTRNRSWKILNNWKTQKKNGLLDLRYIFTVYSAMFSVEIMKYGKLSKVHTFFFSLWTCSCVFCLFIFCFTIFYLFRFGMCYSIFMAMERLVSICFLRNCRLLVPGKSDLLPGDLKFHFEMEKIWFRKATLIN